MIGIIKKQVFQYILFYSLFLFIVPVYAQNTFGLEYNEDGDGACGACREMMRKKPKEILFGIFFRNNTVHFVMNEKWFNKLLPSESYGLSADIVSKDQFECGKNFKLNNNWIRGTLTRPMYLTELKEKSQKLKNGEIDIDLGPVPENLQYKELEANMVLIRDKQVCIYRVQYNLDRTLWHLLDMGMYADTLIKGQNISERLLLNDKKLYFTQERMFTVNFKKGHVALEGAELEKMKKNLSLPGYKIERLSIRAYSSIEGSLQNNVVIQKQRASNILGFALSRQKEKMDTDVIASENWVEFMQAIDDTKHAYLARLSKKQIKQALEIQVLLDSLEFFLARERKAVVSVVFSPMDWHSNIRDDQIIDSINIHIKNKNLTKAAQLMQYAFKKMAAHSLPLDFLDKVEIPKEKDCYQLLNNLHAYRSILGMEENHEALATFKEIEKLVPDNGKVKYNICALGIKVWDMDTGFINKDTLYHQIIALDNYGIDSTLIQRMLLNYGIVLSEIYTAEQKFDRKDMVLSRIKDVYSDKNLNDADLLSIAKYFCFYAQYGWAD